MSTARLVQTDTGIFEESSMPPGAEVSPVRRSRVLIIDDHPLYRAGLQALLKGEAEFEIVGPEMSGAEAVAVARHIQPDLILLDICLGETNGLDLVSQLRRACPEVRIVVLTGHHTRDYLMSAVRLGVHGYLQKDQPGSTIVAALREVAAGQRVIGQPIALTMVLEEASELLRAHQRERCGITDQELEILRLAASGMNNRDIGAHEFMSEITVKRKLQDVYRKLNVKSRAQAVAEVIRSGWI